MRHGESEANVENLIVSDLELGMSKYGLTERGLRQVHDSVDRAYHKGVFGTPLEIWASPFKRCIETAGALRFKLDAQPVYEEMLLRERWFGKFEGRHSSEYESVWAHDQKHPDQSLDKADSATKIFEECVKLIQKLERRAAIVCPKTIILVSHGDRLQIMEAMLRGFLPSQHRTHVEHLEPAEIRLLELH